jgi:hypothetical protein
MIPEEFSVARRETKGRATRPKASRRETAGRSGAHYWSARVTRDSNALDLQAGVFGLKDPKRIAASLKRSAERSRRRKAEPYRSALSMLVSSTAPARNCPRAAAGHWSKRKSSCAGCSGATRPPFGPQMASF